MDKIHIKGLRVYSYHGVNPEEKRDGQPFEVDLTLSLDLSRPCETDRVEDTVSYAQVAKAVRRVLCGTSYDLLERAAQCVTQAVLGGFPAVQSVHILLKKPRAPVKADLDYAAVELERSRR